MKQCGFLIGGSMKPALGMLNWYWGNTKFDYVCVGDIVAFCPRRSLKTITHRVIGIEATGIILIKGDNASRIDRVSLSQIIFKVTQWRKLI